MINAHREEILIGRLTCGLNDLGGSIAKVPAVGERIESQVRFDEIVGCFGFPIVCEYDRVGIARVSQGDISYFGQSQSVAQPFVASKKEGLVGQDGTTDRKAKLIALELRLVLLQEVALSIVHDRVKKVCPIQIVVAMEIKECPMELVASRAGGNIDDSTQGPTKFRAVGSDFYLKLLDRIHPQGHARHAAGQLVVNALDIRTIQQYLVGLVAGSSNREALCKTALETVPAAAAVDTGNQSGELTEIPTI